MKNEEQNKIYETYSFAYVGLLDSDIKGEFNTHRQKFVEYIQGKYPNRLELFYKRYQKENENFWILLSHLMAGYFQEKSQDVAKQLNVSYVDDVNGYNWLDSSEAVSSPWLRLNDSYNGLQIRTLFKIAPCMLSDQKPNYSKIIIIFQHEKTKNNFSIEDILRITNTCYIKHQQKIFEYLFSIYSNTLNEILKSNDENKHKINGETLYQIYEFNLRFLGPDDSHNQDIRTMVKQFDINNNLNIEEIIKTNTGKEFVTSLLKLLEEKPQDITKNTREYKLMSFKPISDDIEPSLKETAHYCFYLKYTTPHVQFFNGIVDSKNSSIVREMSKIRSHISISNL